MVAKAAEEAARAAATAAAALPPPPTSLALALAGQPAADAVRAHLAAQRGGGGALALASPGALALGGGLDADNPEVVRLEAKLRDVTQRLQRGDFSPEMEEMDANGEPAPIYNTQGQRTNTRDVVARERLTRSRNDLIEALLAKCPTFRPPPDWRPMKKERKLYIPQKEYPGAKATATATRAQGWGGRGFGADAFPAPLSVFWPRVQLFRADHRPPWQHAEAAAEGDEHAHRHPGAGQREGGLRQGPQGARSRGRHNGAGLG